MNASNTLTSQELKKCTRAQLTAIWQQASPPFGCAHDKTKPELVEYLMAHPDFSRVTHAYDTIVLGIVEAGNIDEDQIRKLIRSELTEAQLSLDADEYAKLRESIKSTLEQMRLKERIDLRASESRAELTETLFSNVNELKANVNGKLEKVDDALSKLERSRKVEITVNTEQAIRSLGEQIVPDEFETLLQMASQRLNIMAVGPTGCGKTHVAGMVADALDLDFASISCTAGMSESALLGWLLPGEGGSFEYVESDFVRLYENGGIFLLDEVDASDENVLVIINQAISNDGFHLPQRRGNTFVKRHPDFVLMAAANTFGTGADMRYVGRNQLDAATLDRFRAGMIFMDYSDRVEEAIIDSEILAWGRELRTNIRNANLERDMSTRVMKDLTKMKDAYGWGRDRWEQQFFAGWSDDEIARAKGNQPASMY